MGTTSQLRRMGVASANAMAVGANDVALIDLGQQFREP
jgi:hypothetical protein